MMKIRIIFLISYLIVLIGCDSNGITDNFVNSFENSSGGEFTKDGRSIVYSKTIEEIGTGRKTERISEIFISDINGNYTQQITYSNGNSYKPIFSPNEFYIFYQFEKDNNIEIYRINYDGSNRIRLTDNIDHDFICDISHDGLKILFYSERNDVADLYIMNCDGENIKRLTYVNEYIERAEFLPNDNEIIFSYGNQIYKMNTDGSDIISLMQSNGTGYYPSLSADGSKIVYVSFQNDWDIYTMDINGENKVNLTDNNVLDFSPSFSPDGKKIVFHSEREGNTDIYIINTDGSEERRLTQNSGYDEFPKFSPDGIKIAYQSEHSGNWYLNIMGVDGNNKLYLSGL